MAEHKNYHVYSRKQLALETALGMAVARWASLEHALFHLGAWAIGKSPKEAAELFAVFRTFSLTFEFVDVAVRQRVATGGQLTHWLSLVEYVKELSGDRNFLAHTGIIAHGPGDPASADWAEAIPKIGPQMAAHLAGIEKQPPIETNGVVELVNDFQHVIECVMSFHEALMSKKPLPEKFLLRVSRRRPRRSERLAKNRKSPKRPRPPSRA